MKSAIAFLLALTLGPSTFAEESPLSRRIDEAILRAELGQFWGAVLVAKDGKVILSKGYGLANDTLEPITADTLIEIASASKSFTAVAIMTLEMDGKLSLDDPVSKFFPDLAKIGAGITVRHLLNHTSGMSDRAGALQEYGFQDRDEAVKRALSSPRNGQPGEAFDYCNAGFNVLAAVIEKASGKTFEATMRERVFKPAGMARTGFVDGDGLDLKRQTARRVPGQPAGRAMACGFPWGWGYRGAGGIVTSLNDLLKWDAALAGETLLSPMAKERMYQVARDKYACGWYVEFTPRGTRKAHHSGSVAGFHCQLSRDLDEKVFIAVLTNEAWNPYTIEGLIEKEIYPAAPEEVEATIDPSVMKMDEYRNADFSTTHAWRVERGPKTATGGERVLLSLPSPEGKFCVTVALGPRALVALTAAVANVVGVDTAPVDGAKMDAMVCTGLYPPPAGKLVLPPGVNITVEAFYRGQVTDHRPTLSVTDPSGAIVPGGSYSPIIVRMDPGAAAALLRDLKAIQK